MLIGKSSDGAKYMVKSLLERGGNRDSFYEPVVFYLSRKEAEAFNLYPDGDGATDLGSEITNLMFSFDGSRQLVLAVTEIMGEAKSHGAVIAFGQFPGIRISAQVWRAYAKHFYPANSFLYWETLEHKQVLN